MTNTFKGIADYFESAPEKEFIAASLMYMLTSGQIHATLERRAAKMKAELHNDD